MKIVSLRSASAAAISSSSPLPPSRPALCLPSLFAVASAVSSHAGLSSGSQPVRVTFPGLRALKPPSQLPRPQGSDTRAFWYALLPAFSVIRSPPECAPLRASPAADYYFDTLQSPGRTRIVQFWKYCSPADSTIQKQHFTRHHAVRRPLCSQEAVAVYLCNVPAGFLRPLRSRLSPTAAATTGTASLLPGTIS